MPTLRQWVRDIQTRIELGLLDGSKPVVIPNQYGNMDVPVLWEIRSPKTHKPVRYTLGAKSNE